MNRQYAMRSVDAAYQLCEFKFADIVLFSLSFFQCDDSMLNWNIVMPFLLCWYFTLLFYIVTGNKLNVYLRQDIYIGFESTTDNK